MLNHRHTEGLKLFVVTCTTILLGVLAFDRISQGKPGQTPGARDFEIVPMNATLDRRLGENDYPEFVIQFSGETHGNLGPCG